MIENRPLVTRARLAEMLGMTARSVGRRLDGIAPSGEVTVAGNKALAWSIDSLPMDFRKALEEKLNAQPEFRNLEHFIRSFESGYKPASSLSSFSPEEIARAAKMRDALAPALNRSLNCGTTASESNEIGRAEYAAVLGETVSERTFRRLIEKYRARYRKPGDFDRADFYLEAPKAIEAAEGETNDACGIIPELECVVRAFANPLQGTPKEIENLWTRAFEYFDQCVAGGEQESSVRRRVIRFFRCFAQGISKSENGLQIQFSRKQKRWLQRKDDHSVFVDSRRTASGFHRAAAYTDNDVKAVQAHMTGTFRNQAAPAFWFCLRKGLLSAPFADYYREKAHPPRRFIAEVTRFREALADAHLGGNRTEAARPKIRRSYDTPGKEVFAFQVVVADDLTPSLYTFLPHGDWYRLLRPQVLMAIDFRTTLVLGYSIIPEISYSARAIRTLFTRVADEYGLPETYYLENSIWRSHLVAGNKNACAASWPEIEQGLREFAEVRHAGVRKPWVKPIERVFDCIQKALYADPGYCGSDERYDCPESLRKLKLDIEARRLEPTGRLHDFKQFEQRIKEVCLQYNRTAQPQSRILQGLSPMQAAEKFRNPENPPIHFPPQLRFLFAHQKYEKTVTRNNGVTVDGKRYVCSATGELQGKRVLVWYDPDREDSVILTDIDRKNVWVAERFAGDSVPALNGGDTLSKAMQQSGDHVRASKTLYCALKADFPMAFRKTITTRSTLALGAAITTTRAKADKSKGERARNEATVSRASRELGLPPQILGSNADDSKRALERLKRSGVFESDDEKEAQL